MNPSSGCRVNSNKSSVGNSCNRWRQSVMNFQGCVRSLKSLRTTHKMQEEVIQWSIGKEIFFSWSAIKTTSMPPFPSRSLEAQTMMAFTLEIVQDLQVSLSMSCVDASPATEKLKDLQLHSQILWNSLRQWRRWKIYSTANLKLFRGHVLTRTAGKGTDFVVTDGSSLKESNMPIKIYTLSDLQDYQRNHRL